MTLTLNDAYRVLSLPLARLRTDGDTNARAELNQLAVAEYTEDARGGAEFPPGDAFWDLPEHCYWLAGGFHRHAAFLRAQRRYMTVRVRDGNRRDAVLFSAGDNKLHGVRLTNEDKHRAVLILLCDAVWCRCSDREIAEHCGVTHPFVGKLREAKGVWDRKQSQAAAKPASGNGFHQTNHVFNVSKPSPTPRPVVFRELPAKEQLAEIAGERKRIHQRGAVDEARGHILTAARLLAELPGREGAARRLQRLAGELVA